MTQECVLCVSQSFSKMLPVLTVDERLKYLPWVNEVMQYITDDRMETFTQMACFK